MYGGRHLGGVHPCNAFILQIFDFVRLRTLRVGMTVEISRRSLGPAGIQPLAMYRSSMSGPLNGPHCLTMYRNLPARDGYTNPLHSSWLYSMYSIQVIGRRAQRGSLFNCCHSGGLHSASIGSLVLILVGRSTN